jgi:signal peptidase I
VLDFAAIIVAAILISFLIKTFVVQSYFVPSASMQNTLMVNDRVLVPVWTGSATNLKRGDVIVFRDPAGWLGETQPHSDAVSAVLSFLGFLPPDGSAHLVKRIIGLPGDKVSCCSAQGKVLINDTPITEPYVVGSTSTTDADPFQFTVTVPKGMLWVLGDNRFDSEDSAYRFNAHDTSYFVPESDVVGKATLIDWPFGRWQAINTYPDVFAPIGKPVQTIIPQG